MAKITSEDQTLDYQHYIDYQLTHAQGRMKSVEVGTGVVRLITAILAYLLAVIVLDHVLVLPSPVRLGLLLIAVAAAVGYFAVAVVAPGVRRINSFYTARTIEQATPEFKNSLINFLDLRRHPDQIPSGVLSMLEERAVADLSNVHVDEKINHDRLHRAWYGLAGAVLVTCAAVLVNALFMHRDLVASLGRALFPTAEIQPPTRTRLTDIKPGDKTVVAHTPVKVSAVADGSLPDQVTLYWSDDGGKFWHEQPMKNPDSQFDPWSFDWLVEKPSRYYLVGGDCRTREFAIDVTQPPMVTEVQLIYDYPEYTGWAQYTSRNGNIDALEDTTITLTATTNRPAASGQIRFGSTKNTGPAMRHVPNRNDQLTAEFKITKSDSYVIWFETENGETNPRPTSYEIKFRSDLKPTVTVKPGTDQVDPPVPANAIVPIGVTARDDFGIDEVKLLVGQGQEILQTFDLTDLQNAGKEFTTTHRLDLQQLRLGAGEEISYWVEVFDNHQPKRNTAASPHYRIRLGSPLSPNEREDEKKRQTELAKADDAEKAAKAVEQPGDDATQPAGTAPGESQEPGADSGEKEQTPKDERAFDVIRKYLEEQQRQEQTEKSREQDSTKEKQEGKSGDDNESGGSKDSKGSSKQEGKEEGKEGAGSSKSEGAQKPAEDKQDGNKPGSEKSAGGEQGDSKAGANKPGTDKSDSETPGKEKSDGGGKPSSEKPDGEKPGDSKKGTGGDKGKATDKPGDDSPAKEKGDGQKPDGDKQPGSKPSGEKPDESSPKTKSGKTKDEKSGDEKSGGDKPGLDKIGGEKPTGEKKDGEKRPTDSQGGTRVGGEKTGDDKQAGEKPKGDKASGDESAGNKPGEKSSGQKPGESKPGSKDSDENKPDGDKPDGAKPGGEKPSGDKHDGDKADGNKPPGNTPSGEKPEGDKPSSNKPGGGEKGGDKPDGDKQGGEKGSGEKQGGDKAGGDKAGGDKAGGDKAGGDKAGGDKAGGDKAGGEKGGGEKSDGDKDGEGKEGGDKAGDSKGGADGDSKGESQGKGSGKSPGKGTPSGQGNSATGGGNDSTPGQTETPQPGGGPNQGKGPVTKNDDSPRDDASPRSPTPDYSNEGSELVLQRLSEQLDKGEVDPELLKRLGWTREEMEQFVKEFQGPGSTDPNQPNAGNKPRAPKKPTEPGKTTLDEKRVKSTSRRPGQNLVDSQGENYEGRRTKPAPEYEDQVRAYNMSQSKSDKPASAPAGSKPK